MKAKNIILLGFVLVFVIFTAVQYVKKWISLAAASQLVKGREEERDFLLRRVNVVEIVEYE